MNSIPRIVVAVGLILLLIGGSGVVLGGYSQIINNCESGSAISISPLMTDNDTNPQANPVPFDNLSPTEQRIFLEAYTSTYNISEIYQKWPIARFNDTRSVTYRHQQYDVSTIVSDCGISMGEYIEFGGIVSSIIGLGLLGIVGIRRAR